MTLQEVRGYRTLYASAKLRAPTPTQAQFNPQVAAATTATDIPAADCKAWVEEQI